MSNPTALSYLAGRIDVLETASTSLFSFKGQVPLITDLPSTGNSAGDAYIVQEDDSFQVWSGSIWVSGGSIRGTDGADGENGIAGTNGENGADGADGNGIATVSYATETGDLTITLTDTTEYVFNVKGDTGADGVAGTNGKDGVDGVVDYVVRVSGDSLASGAINDAWADYIGVLQVVSSNTDLILLPNSGDYVRVDGKMLRFFCNAPSNDAHHYAVMEDGGSTLFQIHGQEAYTMIWREATTDWLVVPGIINPKTKPEVAPVEATPEEVVPE